jgi:uroporphyrinogen-III synthase
VQRDGQKSLAGRRIVVTRSPLQSEELARRLEDLGAEVILLPMVQFNKLADTTELDEAIANLPEFDWLLFTSANAVRFFLSRCRELGCWPDSSLRIAVVGPATRDALHEEGLVASLAPREFRAAELASEIEPEIEGKHILLPRSDQAGEELPKHLRAAGAIVSDVIAYTNSPGDLPSGLGFESLLRGEADAVTFFSPSAFRHFANLLGDGLRRLNARVALAAVGPVTAAAIRDAGLRVTIEAGQATTGALVAALERYFQETPAQKGRA